VGLVRLKSKKTNIVIRETVDKQLEWDKNKSNCSNKRVKFILNMFYKTKISLNLQGMVLFDPLVLANFVHSEGIKSTNLLDFFIQMFFRPQGHASRSVILFFGLDIVFVLI